MAASAEADLDAAFAKWPQKLKIPRRDLAGADAVEQFRLHWLGRKQGRLKAVSDAWLKTAPPEAKKLIGQRFNKLKEEIEQRLESASAGGLSPPNSLPKPSTSPSPEPAAHSAPSIRSSAP